MSIYIIFYLLFTHWIADFVMQKDCDAKDKSTSNYHLSAHVIDYTAVMTMSMIFIQIYLDNVDLYKLALASCITYSLHWITDYFTSRLNSSLWKKGDVHNFFVSVGFDQVLHYVQLILVFKYLIL